MVMLGQGFRDQDGSFSYIGVGWEGGGVMGVVHCLHCPLKPLKMFYNCLDTD